MPDGAPWPKVSIVTPSYNQGQFLEETIRSVLLQGYPNLQYIVMDGGSTDDSSEIILKYAPWIHYFEIEKDRGQPHAINKGLSRSDGEVFAYLNSDDTYLPGAFEQVVASFVKRKITRNPAYWWCAAAVVAKSSSGDATLWEQRRDVSRVSWLVPTGRLIQPGVFWDRRVVADKAGFDESYHYVFDHKLFTYMIVEGAPPIFLDGEPVATFRLHNDSKTSKEGGIGGAFEDEHSRLVREIEHLFSVKERYLARRTRRKMHIEAALLSADGEQHHALRSALRSIVIRYPESIFSRRVIGAIRQRLVRRFASDT
jgi:glycosyltransferase involved in cell wall biosynthesis